MSDGSKKWILKEIFEARLPDKLAHRKKQGFELPVDAWLRGPLRDQLQEVVLKPGAPISQYIDTDHANRMYRSHQNQTGRFGQVLWSLLVLGRWLDQYSGNNINRATETSTGQLQAAGRS